MKQMTPRERRLVAIGLLVAALAVVWLGLIQPLRAGFADRAERRAELAAQHARNQRLIARTASLRRTAEALRDRQSEFAVRAPDAEQGAEILRQRLEDSLTRAGGQLRSSETAEAPAGWVRASLSAESSHEQMIDLLQRLQTETPYLVIESLSIGADRALNSNRADLLHVKLEAALPLAPSQPR